MPDNGKGCPGGQPTLWERIFSNLRYREALGLSQEPALNHCVIDILELGSGDFLSLVFIAGFDFYCVAVAVECDYFHCKVFVFAVGVESRGMAPSSSN